jgi:hypothetical protein
MRFDIGIEDGEVIGINEEEQQLIFFGLIYL